MKNIKKLLLLVSALFVVLLAFASGSIWYANYQQKQEMAHDQINVELVKTKLEAVKELTTTKYSYSTVGSFQDQNQIKNWKIPFTKKHFVVKYDGFINAGIDLDQVQYQIKGKEIRIHLPKAKVLAHELDEKSMTVFDEDNNLFNPIEVADYKTFSVKQKEIVLKEAIDKGLLNQAQDQAKKTIQDFLKQDSQTKDYKVIYQ
ncbi:DUF4230 domain-containing protein [Vaginisenegalia massiliensis]|uniref:DUF4230 domain-containing protein n=1 Tax=Vaginisenegalia massiliensis TaxID=2058294 RepID=UPI000F54AB94|nr:DUF4230 domain-containing protein [Vaginisenegalia massiliensis]